MKASKERLICGSHSRLGLLLFLAIVSGSVALAATNDDFASRITLVGTNISVTSSNNLATKESGEPDHADNAGGKSVWWSWTAPDNGEVQITTDGSSFDTLLAVYTGTDVTALNVVVTNDDHGVIVTSRVRFEVNQGTEYQLAIDGFSDGTNTDSGDITLVLYFTPGPFLRPANDIFTDRLLLSGLPVITNVSNVLATREADEPFHAQKLGDTSVWFSWTALTSESVRISTEGSSCDTLLAVYSGYWLTNLTEVASNDDIDPVLGLLQSTVTFEPLAGQTFQVAVDGFDGAHGQVVLIIESAKLHLGLPFLLPDQTCEFNVMGPAGQTNAIQASENLMLWTEIGTVVTTNGTATFRDSAATNFHTRFYRARSLP